MLKEFSKVHFIGIGGYGMSALALILLQSGHEVQGSDINSSKITDLLQKSGATVFTGHRAEQVGDARLVVYSTAIPDDNPELAAAREKEIPLWHRSEMLAAILNGGYGIAVAGTHGKTTTTAMVSLLLTTAGLDPTAIIGGEVSFFGGNARLGKSRYIVAEACESDHSFLRYLPSLAVVTNIEADHLEYYGGNFGRLVDTYRGFIDNVREGGTVVICGDDPILRDFRERLRPPVLSYGIDYEDVDLRGSDIRLKELGSLFRVFYRGELLGEAELRVPGRHNVLNALGSAAVGLSLGIDFATIREALSLFDGARRRFDIIGEKRGIMVVDDYAHHPTEIKATLKAARGSGRRLICVFQPHRYTRTSFLWEQFLEAFEEADIVLLDEIYSAGEKPIAEVSSQKMARQLEERDRLGVHVIGDKEEMVRFLKEETRGGDLVITMGAGDIWKVARRFYEVI